MRGYDGEPSDLAYSRGRRDAESEARLTAPSSGDAGGLGILVGLVLSLAVLYPFSTAAAVLTYLGLHEGLAPLALRFEGLSRWMLAQGGPILVAVIVLWRGNRLDFRLGDFAPYWWLRHLTRVGLWFAVAAYAFVAVDEGAFWPTKAAYLARANDPVALAVPGLFAVWTSVVLMRKRGEEVPIWSWF